MSAQKRALAPAGYTYGPLYSIGWPLLLRGIMALSLGQRRSLGRDALQVISHMPMPPLVRGADRIPEDGRFIVVANHYERPGLWMAWPAILISHVVAVRAGAETHWIAIQEWQNFSLWGVRISRHLIRAVFERAFAVYEIIAMPPPDAPPSARSGSIRSAVAEVKRGSILGLMPEGTVGPTPELLPAREGSGLFLAMLATDGTPILPVGLYEEHGRLVAHFGVPFVLEIPRSVAKNARDTWARERVMGAIKELLPSALWGAQGTDP